MSDIKQDWLAGVRRWWEERNAAGNNIYQDRWEILSVCLFMFMHSVQKEGTRGSVGSIVWSHTKVCRLICMRPSYG